MSVAELRKECARAVRDGDEWIAVATTVLPQGAVVEVWPTVWGRVVNVTSGTTVALVHVDELAAFLKRVKVERAN